MLAVSLFLPELICFNREWNSWTDLDGAIDGGGKGWCIRTFQLCYAKISMHGKVKLFYLIHRKCLWVLPSMYVGAVWSWIFHYVHLCPLKLNNKICSLSSSGHPWGFVLAHFFWLDYAVVAAEYLVSDVGSTDTLKVALVIRLNCCHYTDAQRASSSGPNTAEFTFSWSGNVRLVMVSFGSLDKSRHEWAWITAAFSVP